MNMADNTGQDAPQVQDAQTTGAQDALQTGAQTPPENVSDLPAWAQRIIRDTRQEAKERREQLEAIERQRQADEAKRLEEQGKHKELAEQYKAQLDALEPLKAKAEAADAVMQKLLDAQLERLPDDAREMVNTMPGDAQAKLDWLAANQTRLQRPVAPQLDPGAQGDGAGKKRKLTPEQLDIIRRTPGMTEEKYLAALGMIEGE